MNSDQLNDLIVQGEGTLVEFKRSLTSNIGREICAFANSAGGKILLGVSDSGEIIGISDNNRLRSQIQTIARSADPPIRVEMESIDSVISVNIPPQNRKPYSFQGKYYLREGANSQQMSRDELAEFFYEVGFIHFDRSVCPDFSLDNDMDPDHWLWFQKRAKIPSHMSPETALRNLDLITKEYKITNACAWLLAKNICDFNISAHISCVLFMGTTKANVIDRRDFHGDLYSMINDSLGWILSKINIGYIIEKLHREERPELPMIAIREAVINAFVHRDYRSTGNIQVYLFKDRLEIVSPGGLPAGMTESELGISSMPRNPLLFTSFLRMDLIEGIGSGIRLIYDLCREHQVTEPKITISEKFVMVTFFRSLPSEENPTLSEPHQDSNDSEPELIDNDTSPNSEFIQRFLEPSPPIHWDTAMPNPNLTRNYSELHSLLKNDHEKSHSDKGIP